MGLPANASAPRRGLHPRRQRRQRRASRADNGARPQRREEAARYPVRNSRDPVQGENEGRAGLLEWRPSKLLEPTRGKGSNRDLLRPVLAWPTPTEGHLGRRRIKLLSESSSEAS